MYHVGYDVPSQPDREHTPEVYLRRICIYQDNVQYYSTSIGWLTKGAEMMDVKKRDAATAVLCYCIGHRCYQIY